MTDYPFNPTYENNPTLGEIINIPINLNILRYDVNNNYIDTVNTGYANKAIAIDKNNNHIICSSTTTIPSGLKVFDVNWQNPSVNYTIYKGAEDICCAKKSTQIYLLSYGGSLEPYIEIINSTNGQRVGTVLDIWSLNPTKTYHGTQSICVDSMENIYITYPNDNKVVEYNSSGLQINEITSPYTIDSPYGISTNQQKYIAFMDWSGSNGRVQFFDQDLNYIGKFDTSWTDIHGIDFIGDSMNVVITNYVQKRVARYDLKP